MALGRPVNKDTQNKVIVHTIGNPDTLRRKFIPWTLMARSVTHTSIGARLWTETGSIPEPIISMLLSRSATSLSFLRRGT